jgi:phosphotransferase system HPr (HPr) family protein
MASTLEVGATMTHSFICSRDGFSISEAKDIVNVARRFSSEIRLSVDNAEADGKDVLDVVTLAPVKGENVVLTVDGTDEIMAFERLRDKLTAEATNESLAVTRLFRLAREIELAPDSKNGQTEPGSEVLGSNVDSAWPDANEPAPEVRYDRELVTREACFWGDEAGPDVSHVSPMLRPARIVHYMLRRMSKSLGCKREEARRVFSQRTQIAMKDVARIEMGGIPTSTQLQMLMESFGWSIFFLFGISRSAVESAEYAFFVGMGLRAPTMEDRLEFRKLYERLLLRKLESERTRGRGAREKQ